MSAVRLINPIPRALAHYQLETRETFERVGVGALDTASPSIEGVRGSKSASTVARLLDLPRVVDISGREDILVLWPAVGLVEPLLWARSKSPTSIVIHDPEPLRSQFGFGSLARKLARGARSNVRLISHSSEATQVLERLYPGLAIRQLRHPIRTLQRTHNKIPGRVVVAGQYKPVRDLELLAGLGPLLREAGFDPIIVGKGWPEISGWTVDSRFLSELELDETLGRAEVVVLPYKKYFQSGIALRALENGTPTIGVRTSFMETLVGTDSDLLLEPNLPAEEWLTSITSSMSSGIKIFESYRAACDLEWREEFDPGRGKRDRE